MFQKPKPKTDSPSLGRSADASPYTSGREEWLERYGSYIQRASQWRMAAFLSLALGVISISGNIIQATTSKIVPYVVEVDKLGHVSAINRADEATATPLRVIQSELANFVVLWRTVTPDLDLQKKNVNRLSFYVSGSARGQIQQWYSTNNPFERAKDKIVQIEVKSLPMKVSVDSWRVEWTENTRNHSGVLMASESYQATLTVRFVPPTNDEQIMKNPGGIYVTALSSSSVMEPQK